MSVAKINKADFKKDVLDNEGVVFVDFYADLCAPSKITSPIIDQLAEELRNVKFLKVNVDENPELATQFSIFSIPTFIIFNKGKPASQIVGARGKESFVEELKKITG